MKVDSSYRGRRHFREGESERKRVGSQLFQKFFLNGGQLHLAVDHRNHLVMAEYHLLGELDSHDLIFFATISVRGDKLQKNKLIRHGVVFDDNKFMFLYRWNYFIPDCRFFFPSSSRCQRR